MFGFGKPKLPLNPSRRAVIQFQMQQWVQLLSLAAVRQCDVITCPSELGELPISGQQQAEAFAQKIAEHMGLDEGPISIEVVLPHQALGITAKQTLSIPASVLSDPWLFSIVVAQGLIQRRLRNDDASAMVVTDWTAALGLLMLGFALPVCNRPSDTACCGGGCGGGSTPPIEQLRSMGTLTAIDLGYAAGVLASIRQETSPPWSKQLGTDASAAFKQTSKALQAGAPNLLDTNAVPNSESSLGQLISDLNAADESLRYLAAEQWIARCQAQGDAAENMDDKTARSLVDGLSAMLHSRDEQTVITAATALSHLGKRALGATHALEFLLGHRSDLIAAAGAIALMHIDPNELIFEHAGQVLEHRWSVAVPVAMDLPKHGYAAAPVAPSICRRMVTAMRRTEDDVIELLGTALTAVHPDPMDALHTSITSHDTLAWLQEYLRDFHAPEATSQATGS